MGGKKGRNNKGATDDKDSSKDQQIAELTKQNKELNKKIDRLLELLAKEKEGGADDKGAASAAYRKKNEEAQKVEEAKKQKQEEEEALQKRRARAWNTWRRRRSPRDWGVFLDHRTRRGHRKIDERKIPR